MNRITDTNSGLSLVLSFLLLVFFSSVSAATATLVEMKISAEVDMATMAPKNIKNVFQNSVASIWATAYLNHAPVGTSITAKWYLVHQGKYEKLVENKVDADGKRYVAFRLHPVEHQKLPTGEYFVAFLLNGKKVGSQRFTVIGANSASASRKASDSEKKQACMPSGKNDEKLVVSLAANQPAIQKQLAALKLMRYSDPQNRFSLIVPGGWFQAEQTSPNRALYLSQNKVESPVFSFVVSVYNVTLSAEFGVVDTVNQLSKMLVDEGKKHGAKIIQNETAKAEQLSTDVAMGNLLMSYTTSEGKEIGQLHTILVDGKYAVDIQLNAEESVLETALFLFQVASRSIWTEQFCGIQK